MNIFNATWQHRWITPKAKAKDSSIDGLGTIATKNISKGEIVAVFGGIIVPRSEITEYKNKIGDLGHQIDDDFFICPTSREELTKTGVINHSCEPNIGYSDTIKFIAIKDIKPGEELTADYAFSETIFRTFKCKCGSKTCRKIIKPDDWENSSLQKKYGRFFAPYLKRKFILKD